MALVDCGNGVRLERGVRCKLSDGVTLLSDHYYPEGAGPWPTILMRQPYGRDIASTVVYAHPVWFARNGFHVAIQDVRGRGGSEGEFFAVQLDKECFQQQVEEMQAFGFSEHLIRIFELLHQQRIQYVRIDANGGEVDGDLPTFEW